MARALLDDEHVAVAVDAEPPSTGAVGGIGNGPGSLSSP